MFTGIVDHMGVVVACDDYPTHKRITIDSHFSDLVEGESIAVNGCCLTVVSPDRNRFHCDISPETLRCTTASDWVIGVPVNLERAMRLTDRFGGHVVLGHVDAVAQVSGVASRGDYVALSIEGISPEYRAYLVTKGSICIQGVSLTINAFTDSPSSSSCECMLIPHTLSRTTLHTLVVGSSVNIEFDYIARVVARLGEVHVNTVFKP